MASIQCRKDHEGNTIGWQAQVRRKGYPTQSKTFDKKSQAQAWARLTESEMDRGVFVPRGESERTTVAILLERYIREVAPKLKSGNREASKMRAICSELGQYTLAALSSSLVAQYRDKRLATISHKTGRQISPQTVKHEIGLLQRALKKATMEWGIALPGGIPTTMVAKPNLPQGRNRRLVDDEEARLLDACSTSRNVWLRPVVIFALETAMRSGEMLETWKQEASGKMDADGKIIKIIASPGLQWANVDMNKRVALLPTTKNGEARRVPLSRRAVEVLQNLPRSLDGRVFGTTYEGIHQAYVRACMRAGIHGLTFHDLRHEATSRLFEKGLNPMQVAAITGHKTLQMLKRYTHLRAEDLVKLLG
ncbi:site-specific integrase [Acidithiobacillus sp. CV18-2]|nr:site-specific integrase [Acidithiobacillus sp. CV18-3]MBU2757181.1 site-specific integrase [Acidithiobacillus sp. BN09-2]MBU2776979.1 site-specific integrase [Acidithiobacillus sp. CV18-2]MBU2800211.1 site-specific integrase [Acidithiobacillus sp. VAN18-4]